MWRKTMKFWQFGLVLVLVAGALAGCGGGEAAPAEESVAEESSETFSSAALDTSYADALNASSQLALGTIQLEETENSVTSEQATSLLPLWEALQQGGVTAQAEVDAILKQIEGTMTSEQLAAIAAMQLTQEDLRAWMQEQGPGMGGGFPGAGEGQEVSPELRATRQAEFGGDRAEFDGEEMPPEMATQRAEFESMSEEERAAMRATMEAGGGMPGGAGGRPGGSGGSGAGGRQYIVVLNPLIELLTQRAAE
jgi:hypothetical protein